MVADPWDDAPVSELLDALGVGSVHELAELVRMGRRAERMPSGSGGGSSILDALAFETDLYGNLIDVHVRWEGEPHPFG